MNCFAQKVFFAVFALIFLVFPMQAQVDETGRWIYRDGEPAYLNATESPAEKAEIMSRWQKIGDELKTNTSTNEIWGQYWVGDLHISLLRISEKNGYMILHVFTCAMDIHSVEYGDVYFSADKLFMYPRGQFSSRNSHGGKMSEMMPQEWIPIKWRNVNYLVTEENIKEFLDSIGGYGESADSLDFGFKYFSKGKETDSAEALPILPLAFQHLIKKPINGKIISIGKRRIQQSIFEGEIQTDSAGKPVYESARNITINIGKTAGVEKGMRLYILNENTKCCVAESVEIQIVNEKTSIGIMRLDLEDDSHKNPLKRKDWFHHGILKIGMPVTTSRFISSDFIFSRMSDAEEEK